jgi:hypothetical protein
VIAVVQDSTDYNERDTRLLEDEVAKKMKPTKSTNKALVDDKCSR